LSRREIITVLKEIRDALKKTWSGWRVHKPERTSDGVVVLGAAAPPPRAGRWQRRVREGLASVASATIVSPHEN